MENCYYPRKLFLTLSIMFFIILYPLRIITLDSHPQSFVFKNFGYGVDWSRIAIYEYLLLFISILLLALFVPKQLTLKVKKPHIQLIEKIFYFEILISFVVFYLLGSKMGMNLGLVEKLLLFLVYSLLPFDLIFFSLLLIVKNKNKIVIICIIYAVLALLRGSKASLFFLLMALFSISVLRGGKVLNFKYILFTALAVILFPTFAVLGYFFRGEFSFNEMINTLGFSTRVLEVAGVAFSRRISGVDVLMLEQIENNTVFSIGELGLYYLKGLFTAFFVDAFRPDGLSAGIGRMFAIEFLSQPKDIANAYGVTLLGVIHYSNEKILISLLYFLSIAGLLTTLNIYKHKWVVAIVLLYFVYQFPIFIMSGSPIMLSTPIRYFIVLTVVIYLYNKYLAKSHKKLLPKRELY
jgi:hypothetical protein